MKALLTILVLVALAGGCTSATTNDTPAAPRTTCEQVRDTPSLTPGDWKSLVERSARDQGKNEAELWAYFQAQVAQDCPELMVRITG